MKNQLFLMLFIISIALITSCNKDDNNSSITPTIDPNAITVQVNSVPSGADIYIDGGATSKQTPYKFENLSVGSHVFKLTKTEYDSTTHTLYLSTGDNITINDTLKKNYYWEGTWTGFENVCYDYFPFNNTQFIIPSTSHNPIKIIIDTQISNLGYSTDSRADVYFGNTIIGTAWGNQTNEITVNLPVGTTGTIHLTGNGCRHYGMTSWINENYINITRVQLSCN